MKRNETKQHKFTFKTQRKMKMFIVYFEHRVLECGVTKNTYATNRIKKKTLLNTYVLVIVLNRSCPAVSLCVCMNMTRKWKENQNTKCLLIHSNFQQHALVQCINYTVCVYLTYHICSLTRFPSISTVRILKSTPIVVM